MFLPLRKFSLCFTIGLIGLTGCNATQPFYLGEKGDLSYYIDKATDVAYPDVQAASLEEATQTQSPITILDPFAAEFQDLTLEDALSIALQNSKIIRGYGTPGLQGNLVAPGVDGLANNPQGAGTIYNVAVRESEPGFLPVPGQPASLGTLTSNTALESNQGVEAALSEFDAQVSSSVNFNKVDRPRNTIAANPFSPTVFRQDAVQWQSELSKKSATGTQLFFRGITDYDRNNIPIAFQPLPSVWTQSFETEIRQPLARGRGALVNRMPVIIARINTDQEIASLEVQLQNMLCNVEIRYWNLYAAYRAFETAMDGLNSAKGIWRNESKRLEFGELAVSEEAQAREQFFFFRAAVERAYSELIDAENDLRWLMGWAPTDGRLVRPTDEPIEARIDVDWNEALNTTLVRRPELRLNRWEIKKRELSVAYARNSLLPQVNATALYRWLGLGDNLWNGNRNGVQFPGTGSRAWEELTRGNYQEVSLGLEWAMTIGFRRELANVRNAQLKLARELARLEDIELDATRELTMVYRAIDTNYQLAQSNLNRWAALRDEVRAKRLIREVGEGELDLLLDAERRLAESQISYFQSLSEYNKSIALLHRRQGTMLDYCGVEFMEGAWPEKAYFDATGHARRRSASHELDYGWTRPWVISQDSLVDPGSVSGGYIEHVVPGHPTPVETMPLTPVGPMDVDDGIPAPPPEPLEDISFESAANSTSPQPAPPRVDPSVRPASGESVLSLNPVPVGTGVREAVAEITREMSTDRRRQIEASSAETRASITPVRQSNSSVDSLFKKMGLGAPNPEGNRSTAVIRTNGQ